MDVWLRSIRIEAVGLVIWAFYSKSLQVNSEWGGSAKGNIPRAQGWDLSSNQWVVSMCRSLQSGEGSQKRVVLTTAYNSSWKSQSFESLLCDEFPAHQQTHPPVLLLTCRRVMFSFHSLFHFLYECESLFEKHWYPTTLSFFFCLDCFLRECWPQGIAYQCIHVAACWSSLFRDDCLWTFI